MALRWFCLSKFWTFCEIQGEIVFFFPDSLVTARAQLQPAHPNGRACDITEDHDIHELFVLVLIHCNILWDTYISWLRYSTLKIPLDIFDLWRLVSLEYLKRLQPVLRATSRAGKCSNQVEGVFQWSQWGMYDPTWFKMGVQGLPWFFWKRFLWTKMRVFECFWQLQDAHWSCGIVLVGYDLMKDHEEVHSDHNRRLDIVRWFPELARSVLDHKGILIKKATCDVANQELDALLERLADASDEAIGIVWFSIKIQSFGLILDIGLLLGCRSDACRCPFGVHVV